MRMVPLAALVLSVGLLGTACGRDPAGNNGNAGQGGGPGGGRPTPVRVEPAAQGALDRDLERTGTLRTDSDVEVAARYGGRLVEVPVKIGDTVTAGQLLARIDDRDVRRSRQEAAAGLDVAAASQVTAGLDQQRTQRELERIQQLAAEGLITTQQLDDARTSAALADAALDLAEAQVVQARARLESLQLQEGEARLVAPFAGVIADRYQDAGDTVQAGSAVVRIVGGGILRARVQVSDRDAVLLEVGMPVQARVDAFPGDVFEGTISGIAPAVDPDSGTVTIEAAIDDDRHRLLPGMFARLTVTLPRRADAVLVPADAVLDAPGDGTAMVYVLRDNVAHQVAVVPGNTEEGRTEILEGIDPGDRVVVGGQHALRDGAQVEVMATDGADPGAHGGDR